jgi:hypothetical protein
MLSKNSSANPVLGVVEPLFGILTVAMLILVVNKGGGRNGALYILLAILFLLGYYIAWALYYTGVVSPWVLILGIGAMPPLYFLFVAIWMKNYVALIPCVVFGAAHITVTAVNYLK